MTNNRQKGKRIERNIAGRLRHIFPDIRRNAGTQSQSGGVDLENTGCFNIEVKGGKSYKSKMIRSIIDQAESEGKDENYTLAIVSPDREEPYIIMPLDDFVEVLGKMKAEGII